MKKCEVSLFVAASLLLSATSSALAQTVTSKGSAFSAGLYSNITGSGPIQGTWSYGWVDDGSEKTTFLTSGAVNLAISESPLTALDLSTYSNAGAWGPLIQVPAVATALVLPYKETGITTLNLTTAQICRIFSFQPSSRVWDRFTTAADDGAVGSNNPVQVVYRNEATGSNATELLSRYLSAACGPFMPAGKSFTVSKVFKTMVANALVTPTAAQDSDGDGLPDVWIGVSGEVGMSQAFSGTQSHRLGYMSPDPVYGWTSNSAVARIDGVLATEAGIQAALPTPPSGADRTNPMKWIPEYSVTSGTYPIWGTVNLLLSQCYAGGVGAGTRGAAIKNFLQNFNDGTYAAYSTMHNFARMPAAWNAAIAAAFLNGTDGNGLAFGNVDDCTGIPGRP